MSIDKIVDLRVYNGFARFTLKNVRLELSLNSRVATRVDDCCYYTVSKYIINHVRDKIIQAIK